MGKDESELVPMNKEPGYGGTDAEESKKPDIDISDFKKIITAFYSATRGGLMVFRSLFAILDRRGIVHVDHNETCDRCPRCRRVIENSPAGTWTKSWVGR